jgi:hypothetical protein
MPTRMKGRTTAKHSERLWGWGGDALTPTATRDADSPDQVKATKRKRDKGHEHVEEGEPGRYLRAPWDTLVFDESERRGPHIYALWNYRLRRMEWSATDPETQPPEIRDDYRPPGVAW